MREATREIGSLTEALRPLAVSLGEAGVAPDAQAFAAFAGSLIVKGWGSVAEAFLLPALGSGVWSRLESLGRAVGCFWDPPPEGDALSWSWCAWAWQERLRRAMVEVHGPVARRCGAVFTSRGFAEASVELAVTQFVEGHGRLPRRCCDPCCGTGSLLLALCGSLLRRGQEVEALGETLWGMELDAHAAGVASLLLWRACSGAQGWRPTLRCGDTLSEAPQVMGPVEVLVANPPFTRACRRERLALASRFCTLHGAYDAYVPFMEWGVEALDRGGVGLFITPNKYLSSDYGKKLRRYLNEVAPPRALLDFSAAKPFAEQVDVLVTLVEKGGGDAGCVVAEAGPEVDGGGGWGALLALGQGQAKADGHWSARCLRRPFPWHGEERWGRVGTVFESRLREQLAGRGRPLGELVPLCTGTMGYAYGAVLAEVVEGEAGEAGARVTTPSHLLPYGTQWGSRVVRLGGRRYVRPLVREIGKVAQGALAVGSPKLLVRGIGRRAAAWVDVAGAALPLVAVHGCVVSEPQQGFALAALLNSAPVVWWLAQAGEMARVARGSRRFALSVLREVPVPVDLSTLVQCLGRCGALLHAHPADGEALAAVDAGVADLFGVDAEALRWLQVQVAGDGRRIGRSRVDGRGCA